MISAVDKDFCKRNIGRWPATVNSFIDLVEGFNLLKEDINYLIRRYYIDKNLKKFDDYVDRSTNCDDCSFKNKCTALNPDYKKNF